MGTALVGEGCSQLEVRGVLDEVLLVQVLQLQQHAHTQHCSAGLPYATSASVCLLGLATLSDLPP